MKACWIILVHIVAVVLLFGLGMFFNGKISSFTTNYSGVITVFSVAFTCYTTFLNFWYHKSPRFHFAVNRFLLRFVRTHTYWQPHFDLQLDNTVGDAPLTQSWEILRSGHYGRAVKKDETPTTFSVSLDDLFFIKFRLNEKSLVVSFEHKLLVPSHLYDAYRQKLARLVEDLVGKVRPITTRCGILIGFAEGKRNPYYGFFISRIPDSLLDDFQVTFRLDAASDCRIEAGQTQVNIEGTRLTEVFDALAKVLALQAFPSGDM